MGIYIMKMFQRNQRVSRQIETARKRRKPDDQPTESSTPLSLSSLIGNKAMQRLLQSETSAQPKVQRDDLPTNAEHGFSPNTDRAGLYQPLDASYVQSLDYAGLRGLHDIIQAEVNSHDASTEENMPLIDNLRLVDDAIAENLAQVFARFPDGLQKDGSFPKNTADRMEFMEYMAAYLGTYQNVIDHFMDIREAKIPGSVHLHDSAATRVEGVAADLGNEMPASYVGLGLRGRYRVHERNSNSRMAHPLGYAMDYRAYDNPMITDNDTVSMLNIDTGGAINMDLGMQREERRKLLAEMGRGEADEKKMEAFFQKFEQEYERTAKASASFGDSLGEDAFKTLKELRPLYLENNKQRKQNESDSAKLLKQLQAVEKKLKYAKKNVDALTAQRDELVAKQEELNASLGELDEEFTQVQEQLQDVLKPWYEKIALAKAKIEADNPDVFGEQTDDDKKLSKQELRRRKEIQDKRKSYDDLEARLKNDIEFVLGGKEEKVVRNPSLLQLMERGFFTPDAEPKEGEKFNANKHGFNLKFMMMMAKYGFDQGIAWSENSLDAMHFELVEGVDSLPGKKQTEAGLKAVERLFPRKK
jgi:hypothetical protein